MDNSIFTYVKIPAGGDEVPIEELTASTAGGLENDALVANAKAYFQLQANKTDDPFPTCDIMALTIPLESNQYHAVSLYASDYGVDKAENTRATQLVTACGHTLPEPIKGDVFIGRAEDNETADVWQRRNFTKEDADPKSGWCRTARSAGGGGGQGATSASSLSTILQQQFSQNATAIGSTAASKITDFYGMNGAAAVEEAWGGRWTQTSEEVEVKLTIPTAIEPEIQFKRNHLFMRVGDNITIQGTLFAPVVPNECTYTIEASGEGHKEISVTLAKADEGKTWSWLVNL